jgi:hypothetical protein
VRSVQVCTGTFLVDEWNYRRGRRYVLIDEVIKFVPKHLHFRQLVYEVLHNILRSFGSAIIVA